VTQSVVEDIEKPIETGNELLGQMLRFSRNLFGLAALALVAIAATVGAMYVLHEGTSSWVSESRELSRLARMAYVLTVERELSLIDNGASRPDAVSLSLERQGSRLSEVMDSLVRAGSKSPERANRIVGIQDAEKRWLQEETGAREAEVLDRRTSRAKKRFDVLRTRLALFVMTEDLRYGERIERERNIRLITSCAILLEVLVLLMVLNGIRNKLVSQATEVIRQKESLEQQASELEISNRELAAAIGEKEKAFALMEEEADEQSALFNAITEVFFVIDHDGIYHKVSPTNDDLLALSRDELLGRRVQDVLPGPIAALALSAISKALSTNKKVDVEYPLELHGKTVWFGGTVNPLTDDRVLWVVRDISDTKMAAEAIKESEARFRNLVEHSPQAVALHAEGRFLYANPACAHLLGYAGAEQIAGEPMLRFITRETSKRFVDSLITLSRTGTRTPTCECQFKPANEGRILDVEVTSVPVTYNGRAGVLSILHDVTERKQLEQQLAHQAFHDPLTNLANRVLFRDRVEHALQRAVRGGGTPAVLFIDLDNFKAVNDGLGHSAGDWLLIEVANRLQMCLRPADTVARLGGDEFAVLLDDEAAKAEDIAERILQHFRHPFTVQGTDIVVTMSIGIASLLPQQGADDVLRNADLALYRAKGEGKACVASFEPEMHVAALRRLELETELRRAIEGDVECGQLALYYQPIARLSTGRMFGYEALVRWRHPERGLLEPLDFISLAEETGLIVPLGRWVLEEACRQTRDWQKRYGPLLRGSGMSLMVGVNLSGRHLSQPELVDDVSATLKKTGLTPSHLVLEMTESMLVHDNRATLERLHALKSLGVRLSIDDFGTGYSSLAYLERFPVDSLKMDRSFIASLDGQGDTKSPLAEAVIGLGRILGLKVVAEGIETKEQWERLRELGCGLGQGFYISYPLPAGDFERLIATSAAEAKGITDGRFPVGLSGGRRTPVNGLTPTG
jgi:diguanylate cyclase (GGDEF)-like protein/PAS domain S-box-containing protein